MGKIIGFYIGKEETKFNPDVFSVGLEKQTLFHAGYFITVWGVGPLNIDPSMGYLSLAFDGKRDLMDRNVVIELAADSVNVKNDWLGSIPVFYNAKEKVVSTICNLCLFNKETDLQGIANYFSFGYNAFERTVFKDVKFLRYLSEIKVSQNSLVVSYKEDPVLNADFEAECTEENAVIEMMQAYIYGRESSTKGDIILPTSGGYDSRILNYFVQDKSRIRSFTYGISKFQSNSFEVVHAKKYQKFLIQNGTAFL